MSENEMNGELAGVPHDAIYLRVSSASQERVRVAVYVRSSAESADGTKQLLAQLEGVTRYVDEAGYQVVRTYIETGSAGPEWPAVAQLLDDAASSDREFDALVVWSFGQLSRNVQRFIALRRTLSDAGVRLISVTEPTREMNLGRRVARAGRSTRGLLRLLKGQRWERRSGSRGHRRYGVPLFGLRKKYFGMKCVSV